MKVDLFKNNGEKSGSVDLPKEIFEVDPNDHVLYLEVKRHLAAKRQGTHKSKERAEIIGSTKKIKRQKGTGTARAGSIKSPIFRGGGRVFGPRPRNYDLKLNKKEKTNARNSAFSTKAKEGSIVVIEDPEFKTPKTKDFKALLEKMGFTGNKTLWLSAENDSNAFLSSRNLPKVSFLQGDFVDTYSILHADKVVLYKSYLDKLSNS